MAMIENSVGPVAQKLPVVATVLSAFGDLVTNWRAAVRMSATWGAILVGVGTGAFAMLVAAQPTLAANPLLNLLVLYSPLIVYMLFAISAAVGWHRLLLLDEAPQRIYLRLDRPVWRYVGASFLMALIIWGVSFALSFPLLIAAGLLLGGNPAEWSATQIAILTGVGAALYIVAALVALRLSIALPARAIGERMRFRDAITATRGNSWRIVGGTFLIFVPIGIVHAIMNLLLDFQVRMENGDLNWLSIVGFLVTMAIALAALVALTLVSVGYISRAYRFFAAKMQDGKAMADGKTMHDDAMMPADKMMADDTMPATT